MTGPALEFCDLHKSYGAVRALRGVSFRIREGETHGCIGENGAGKSTLLKILAGLVQPDRGEIRWRGERLRVASPRDALACGIEVVYQERLCFPNLSVAANIFAGREVTRGGGPPSLARRLASFGGTGPPSLARRLASFGGTGRLDEAAMRSRAAEVLQRLHLAVSPDMPMERLSPAHVQLVQVARALAFDCRVLVLDEPTTSLTDVEAQHLFDVLATLKSRGVTVLFVSHRMPEVFRLCDRITVLRDGEYIGTYDRQATEPDEIVRAMVGRPPPARVESARPPVVSTPALSLRAVTRAPRVRQISLDVWPGEIVAVFGLVGSGRTELLESVFGLARPDEGSVEVHGRALEMGSPVAAMRAGVALVPEDRQREGLFFNLTLRDNLALPASLLSSQSRIRDREEQTRAAAHAGTLSIRAPSLQVTPDRLSGGNQQKVVVGKWLGIAPRVLLLDEPTKGVDVGAKFEIHNIIRREAGRGMACLVASSDLPEVLALAHRILVMRDGRIEGELLADDATEERVMQLATRRVEPHA